MRGCDAEEANKVHSRYIRRGMNEGEEGRGVAIVAFHGLLIVFSSFLLALAVSSCLFSSLLSFLPLLGYLVHTLTHTRTKKVEEHI